MKKVRVKDLIKFRAKNDLTKITFVRNLKKEKKKSDDSSGGDYWISCLSAIRNLFKLDDVDILEEKINLLQSKIEKYENKGTKIQFQRNIDLINSFKEYDYHYLKPNSSIEFLKQKKSNFLLDIKGLPIEAKPCHIYKFSENGSDEIGGVWFIAQLGGFKKSELAMFSDMIFRYLDKHYSKDFYINHEYCIAVDIFNGQEVRYFEIKNGEVPILIDSTIDELKKI